MTRCQAERGTDQSQLAPLRRELARYHREFGALRTALHRAAVSRHSASESLLGPYLPNLQQDVDNFYEDAATLQERGRFVQISHAALIEAHPHDITITRTPPNYHA